MNQQAPTFDIRAYLEQGSTTQRELNCVDFSISLKPPLAYD